MAENIGGEGAWYDARRQACNHDGRDAAHRVNRHLAGVIPASYPRAPQLTNGNAPPRYDGTVSEFAANLDEAVAAQMWNRAKVCAACSKPCAVTLAKCNACFESLTDVAVTATENIVMGFVYGVAHAAKFPLKISIRLEVADTLVYDDPLARSTAHLNAIPTDVHIPDWRWLLLNPSKAITLLNRLDQRAFEAVEATVYGNDGWRSEVLRPGAVASADELRPHCIAALNAVPSQYQIHLHYIVPPLLPNDNHCLLTGQRFSRGRWLPLSYVIAALKALQPMNGLKGATEMETADALSAIAALPNGPSYEEYFNAALESTRPAMICSRIGRHIRSGSNTWRRWIRTRLAATQSLRSPSQRRARAREDRYQSIRSSSKRIRMPSRVMAPHHPGL